MFEAIDAADRPRSAPIRRSAPSSSHGEGKSFCSGLDFPSFLAEGRPIDEMFERRDGEPANLAQRVAYGWQTLPAPVIAPSTATASAAAPRSRSAPTSASSPPTPVLDPRGSMGADPRHGDHPLAAPPRPLRRRQGAGPDRAACSTATRRCASASVTRLADDPLAAARELAAEIAARSPDATRRGKACSSEAGTRPPPSRWRSRRSCSASCSAPRTRSRRSRPG